MIQISAQHGDPKSDRYIWPIHKKFNDLFEKNMRKQYFSTISILSIILRVSGKITDFGAEGPERLRYIKKENEITVDLVIPEKKWRGVDSESIKDYIADGVADCFELLVSKAETMGEILDIDILKNDFEKAMAEFHAAKF